MPVETSRTHLICVRVPHEVYEDLVKVKDIEGCTMSALLLRCVKETLRSRAVFLANKHHIDRVRARKEAKEK